MEITVLQIQQWLNKTYRGKSGYNLIREDNTFGDETIGALIRALQIELGITTPNGVFGPATTAAFGELSINSTRTNQVYILQGALFCKGYDIKWFDGNFGENTKSAIMNFQLDIGFSQSGSVNSLLMKQLLNRNSFKLSTGGDPNIRKVQQNLNHDYSSNKHFMEDIGILITDGLYGELTYKALVYALQIEEGVNVDGQFGLTTQSYCPKLIEGSSKTRFIYLLQYALYCYGFNTNGFDGQFGSGTKTAVIEFQKFICLISNGVVGAQTWASLFVSTGDKSRKGTICDCSNTITIKTAQTIKENGYKVVGRYLTGNFKMTSDELNIIFDSGLRVIPIYETGGYKIDYFNEGQGISDAKVAIEAAQSLGLKPGIIYFAVDFDVSENEINKIRRYFAEINNIFTTNETNYKIGIYAPRKVCSIIASEKLSCSSFVCDMSSAFKGNKGHPLPSDWAIDQISTITIGSGEGNIEIDNNISSGRDLGISR
ncbi:DUF1906 domain-containing protein [Clostridium sp. SHJSY1]|uniref:glycoside hydrolase domain-containing protein n=1 Tax=Clostridium sp. SHJSY1 TaxID=2942483 RepID=UPI00287434A1|nr:glycoside hydrolase domain-containing protein [Clostridium sp. SHJSY1]MDS0525357.1 DUF1906 domain-containing protein [Clostridium sp. SHJSY1]